MLPWEIFIFGSSELARNECKTAMRYGHHGINLWHEARLDTTR